MDPYEDREADLRSRLSRNQEDHDDDEFSMSSYDGEQGDSLVIKPPQAVVQRREKKRDRRDRHRHKGERHKDRHKNREHRGVHEERRREHRRHRERDPERREGRRHEKRRDRSKHERPPGDMKSKSKKGQKILEQERRRERERMREREELLIDDRDFQEIKYPSSRGGHGHHQFMYHRDRRHEERMYLNQTNQMVMQLSPSEKAEREKRVERFLQAEKQEQLLQREADMRRQKREEERREEKRMEELRQRAEASMLRHRRLVAAANASSPSRKRNLPQAPLEVPETVELISDDEEHPLSPLKQDEEMDPEEEHMDVEMYEEDEMESQLNGKQRKYETKREEESDNDVKERDSNQSSSASDASEDSDSSSGSGSSDEEEDDEAHDSNKGEASEKENEEENDPSHHSDDKYSEGSPSETNSDSSTDDTSEGKSSEDEDENVENNAKDPTVGVKEELPPYYPAIMGCRSVDEFECLNRIEEGTYGVVYRAREKSTNEIVALKRLKMEKEKEGFPITSLREVNTLLKGQHENVVTVREIVVGSNMDKIYIVMDYVEHDLKSLMETMRGKKQSFTIGEVKTLMIQLLRAVHHLHDNWILHRDLKTSNLLLSHRGILKVGDFGLAREYGSPLKQYTPIVVTLWYRAPELLLGGKEYSTPIDVWSCGCIFGELLGMEPMFPGKSEIDQLNKIFKDLGTPSDKIWPGYSQMSVVKKTQFADYPYNHLRERFKTRLSQEGFNLLNKFLTYNPSKRITCLEATEHAYFHKEPPAPIDPAMFPTWPAKSENPHGRLKKTGNSPKPPSGGKIFKELVVEDENLAGFFLGGAPSSGPGFTLKF